MKRWMALAVGIAPVVAGCSTSSTPRAPDEVGTPTTTSAPTTTAAPATVYSVEDPHDPTYYPEPVTAGSSLFGSGCSRERGVSPGGSGSARS